MKKFTVLFLIFLCLTFNVIGLKPAFAMSNIFAQGMYKLSDFNPSQDNTYFVSNTSPKDDVYLIILNENQVITNTILLQPNSGKHITVPIFPDYRVVILGKGEIYLTPGEPKK